jgi:phosphate transport system protein
MPGQAKHICSNFDAALYGLRNDVLMMSSLTDRMFQAAVEGVLNRDSDVCCQVVTDDNEIDILEKKVDLDGINILVRFQPVASDMREVISAMKISTSLERIGDQAVTIARRAKRLNARPAIRELALLEPPYRAALAIFRDSIRAFADGDCEHARTLKLKDRELDALTDDLIDKLSEWIARQSAGAQGYLDLIFVARALEGIGDSSANIAEDSFWRDQAEDIRHSYGPKEEWVGIGVGSA